MTACADAEQNNNIIELGRTPIMVKPFSRVLKFYLRVNNNIVSDKFLSAAINSHKLYDSMYIKFSKNVLNWSNVQSDMCHDSKQLDALIDKIKLYLKNAFSECALDYLASQDGKLYLYKMFKKSYKFEKYLEIPNFDYRRAVTKFRLSDHKLPIELGRSQNIERDRRFCTLCKNDIGNECHILLECKNQSLSKLRFQFLVKINNIIPQFEFLTNKNKMYYLLGMFDDSINFLTAKYCYNVLRTYKQSNIN